MIDRKTEVMIVNPLLLAEASLDAFNVLHRAFLNVRPRPWWNMRAAYTAWRIIESAQRFVLTTGIRELPRTAAAVALSDHLAIEYPEDKKDGE